MSSTSSITPGPTDSAPDSAIASSAMNRDLASSQQAMQETLSRLKLLLGDLRGLRAQYDLEIKATKESEPSPALLCIGRGLLSRIIALDRFVGDQDRYRNRVIEVFAESDTAAEKLKDVPDWTKEMYANLHDVDDSVRQAVARLPVQQPPPIQESIAEEFEALLVQVQKFGSWGGGEDLLVANKVSKNNDCPGFVADFRKKLDIELDLESLGEQPESWLVGDRNVLEKYALPRASPEDVEMVQGPNTPSRKVDRLEASHIKYLTDFGWTKAWRERWGVQTNPYSFKEQEAYSTILYPFAISMSDKLTINRSRDPWPLPLIVFKLDATKKDYRQYLPHSDFAICRSQLPRFLLEVNSTNTSGFWPEDLVRMLLSASAIVRLANGYLPRFREKRDCVLPAVYLTSSGGVRSFFLYQKQNDTQNYVYYVEDATYELKSPFHLVKFTRRLYSLAHTLSNDDEDEEISKFISDYTEKVRRAGYKSFHTKDTKRSRENDAENGGTQSKKSRGGRADGGNSVTEEDSTDEDEDEDEEAAELRAHGYKARRTTIVTDGGVFKPLFELPPNIRDVRDLSGKFTANLVAKKVRKTSNEASILKQLKQLEGQPGHQHIIPVYNIVEAPFATWLILPELSPIRELLLFDRTSYVSKAPRLCWNLLEGVGFLHRLLIAHRDIKPDNLVIDPKDLTLKIIDFDVAIHLKNEDDEVEDHCGTEGWEAPELVEKSRTVAPIRCDRWACGAVIKYIIKEFGGGLVDKRLQRIAEQLSIRNPLARPSLLEPHQLGLVDEHFQPPCKRENDTPDQEGAKKKRWPDARGQGVGLASFSPDIAAY